MKRTFTLAITICLLLSFCFTSFADTLAITRIYKGDANIESLGNKDGEYIYTFIEHDGYADATDFGVSIDGEKYSVGEDKVEKVKTDKQYAIGISDPENTLTDFYIVTPYVTVGDVDVFGEPLGILKQAFYEKMNSVAVEASTEYICDDANSDVDYYLDWYLPDLRDQGNKEDKDNTSGTYMQASIHNGVNDETGNEILNRALIQLDLTKMEGVDTSKPVELSVWGHATYYSGDMTNDRPESFTVNAYGTYNYEWTEAGISSDAAFAGPTLSEIKAMPVIDSFEVPVPEDTSETGTTIQNDWYEVKIDVAKIVDAAIKAGKTKATVILAADNSAREQYGYELDGDTIINHDEVKFQMFTKDVTKSWLTKYKPTVSFFKFTDEYTELEYIKLNGENLESFDPKTFDYTVAYLDGDAIPTVKAKASNEESRVVITQANGDNKTATIKVYDEQNIRTKTYTITFVANLPSEEVTDKDVITADAHSRIGYSTPDAVTMYTNLYNGTAYASGNESSLMRAYIQVDVTKLTDIDFTEDIYLNVYGKINCSASYVTEHCPTEMTVNVYGAMKSDFPWSEATASVLANGTNSFGPNLTKMKQLTKVDAITFDVPFNGAGVKIDGSYTLQQVKITDIVKKAIEDSEEYITFIFSADNTSRNTEELLALKTANSNARDSITYTILTKEYQYGNNPSVTYSKYESKYTDLAEIKVDGKAIADFDKETFEYFENFEGEIPEVSATGADESAKVDVTQATAENGYKATITVSNKNMSDKVYTVTFKPVVSNVLANVITDDVTSRIGYSAVYNTTMQTNLSNGAGPGWESALRRAYVQLDLTKFENIENIQNVYMNITDYVRLDASRMSANAPTEIKIDVYGIPSSEFDEDGVWSESEYEKWETNSFGPNIATTKTFAVQDSYTIPLPVNESGSVAPDRETRSVDITKIVKSTLEANAKLEDASAKETKVTIIFMADNTSRKEYATSPADDATYYIHTKDEVDTYATRRPTISYTTYDASLASLSSIEIDGVAIDGFNADIMDYTASVEDGEEIPEVAATALYGDATVTVSPATADNGYIATITVENEGVTSKTYTVTFNIGKKSTAVETKTAIIGDSGSSPKEVGYADGVTAFTNIANGWPLTWSSSGLKRIYIQVGLDELTDADYNKDIKLHVTGKTMYTPKEIDPSDYPEALTINAYGATSEVFPWSEKEVNDNKPTDLGPSMTNTVKLPLLGQFTMPVAEYVDQEAELSGSVEKKEIDITEFAREAHKNGDKYITVILFADNTDFISKPRDTYLGRIKYSMYTSEYTSVVSWQPYVSYSKFNSEYADLTEITLDGTALEGFDKDTYEYTVNLEADAEIPEVSATAYFGGAEVVVSQATADNNYKATISVKNDGMATRIYTVTFNIAQPDTVTIFDAITADAHSSIDDGLGADAETMFTNIYNGIPYEGGNESELRRAMMKLDISALEGADLSKDIILNITGETEYSEEDITENCPESFTVNVYRIPQDEGFVWGESELNDYDITTMLESEAIASITVNKDSGDTVYAINITEAVNAAVEAGEAEVILVFSADNELFAEIESDKSDMLKFVIYTTESANKPSVTYYPADAE